MDLTFILGTFHTQCVCVFCMSLCICATMICLSLCLHAVACACKQNNQLLVFLRPRNRFNQILQGAKSPSISARSHLVWHRANNMGMETNDHRTSCACGACVSWFNLVHTCKHMLLLVGVPVNTHVVRQFGTIWLAIHMLSNLALALTRP